MDAETYITTHWIPKRIWTHLAWPRHQERLRRCAELMPAAGQVLDVGCACGHSTEIMRLFRPELSWFGADFSETAVERAKVRFPEMMFYFVSSPVSLGSMVGFEGIVCSEVLEHTPDDVALAEALLKITSDTLVLTTPVAKVSDPGHLRVYTAPDLERLFTRSWAPGRILTERWGDFYYLIFERRP